MNQINPRCDTGPCPSTSIANRWGVEIARAPRASASLFLLRGGGGGLLLPGLVLTTAAACLGAAALGLGGLGAPRRSPADCRIPSGGGAVLTLLGLLLKQPRQRMISMSRVRRAEAFPRRDEMGCWIDQLGGNY